jgi:acyl-CoA synthetase (AMP-forming)/AMP-acid ligase II
MKDVVQNVATYLSSTAKEWSDQPALVSGAVRPKFLPLSFSQLDHAVDGAVSELIKSGISAGDKTLLFVNPGPGLIIWAFALFRLGAIPVVIDPGMGVRSFLSCIQRTKPNAMVGISRAFWLSRLLPRSFRTVRSRYLVRPGFYTLNKKEEPSYIPNATSPDALAAIVFTSGSTGIPKGVRYLHRTFDAQINALKNVFGMEAGEVDLTTLPIFGLFNPALGITSVLPDIDPRRPAQADPAKLVRSLLDYDVTTAFASPVIGKKVANECQNFRTSLNKIKRFFLAGAPVPPSLAEQLNQCIPHGRVIVPYGATEALPVSSTDSSEISDYKSSTLEGKGSLVGTPIPGAKVRILDITHAPLPDYPGDFDGLEQGVVGEICVSGKMVTAGYDRMPGATCDARFKIGKAEYHRMGDLGYIDEQKRLRFLGRKAECVRTANGLIETERCEPAISQLSFVQRCALIGLGESPRQEPCMVVEPVRSQVRQFGEIVLRRKILEACQDFFPEFQIQRVFFEKKIPVDARHNAKIHRLALSRKWSRWVARKPKLGKLT